MGGQASDNLRQSDADSDRLLRSRNHSALLQRLEQEKITPILRLGIALEARHIFPLNVEKQHLLSKLAQPVRLPDGAVPSRSHPHRPDVSVEVDTLGPEAGHQLVQGIEAELRGSNQSEDNDLQLAGAQLLAAG